MDSIDTNPETVRSARVKIRVTSKQQAWDTPT